MKRGESSPDGSSKRHRRDSNGSGRSGASDRSTRDRHRDEGPSGRGDGPREGPSGRGDGPREGPSGRGDGPREGPSGRGDRPREGPPGGGAGHGEHDRGEPSGRGFGRGGGGDRGGRGGGRGRGEGRGARRRQFDEDFDMVVSRAAATERVMSKQAVLGNSEPVHLQSNFFKVDRKPDWCMFHYRVDFKPDETDTRLKKKLMRPHAQSLGANIFDGSSLYTANRLHPDPMTLYSLQPNSEEKIELTVRMVAELAPTDGMYLQLFNILVRKCLEGMSLEEMGRHFYDRHQAIRLDAHRLELWPGYITTMRNHENSILLGVEITHKVLRLDSCLQVMNEIRRRSNDENRVKTEIVGSIVMTSYNRKTYRVDDIEWSSTPTSTFDMKGVATTFIDYFQQRYNITIRDHRQPLLVSRPKKRDLHRGQMGPILLIPELCQMTGLTDEMRANNQLMRALATHLHTDPNARVAKLKDFMQRLKTIPSIVEELNRWGLSFQDRLIEVDGHVIPPEKILFGEGKFEVPNDRYDWNAAFRNKPMYTSVPLKQWVIICPGSAAWCVDKMVNAMQRVSRPLNFPISNPIQLQRISSDRPNDYAKAIDDVMNQHKRNLQLLFVVLPRQVTDVYSAVKKRASLEFGVPSQCFVAKNAQNDKGLMSICTKLVVQMNAKLGGEPWTVAIPLKNLMIVGFDVYHCGKRKGSSVGAMVATTAASQAKYYSTISHHSSRDDLSERTGADFTKCLHAYSKINNALPDRIIMYRDGVGEGQLKYVYETELGNIRSAIDGVYKSAGREATMPKFTFIVVTKRLNTRIFGLQRNGHVNPGPGTVVDDVITFPERYDFYLVAQHSRQGTVSPVAYNVLYDRQGLDSDKIQRLTYKLCHMYFNWSGTVTVPAPCQYAHKLAYLTGLALGAPAHERLSNLLHYL
ncbi:unnamed protein product [Orchesella dallaii]|uniref:Protein aubergine n=1 Tax=Orchesella dallaii TaxID=48710 RepID=A0ABP1QZY4_9HEXA